MNVKIFFWTIQMSVIVLGIILLAAGFVIGYVTAKVGKRSAGKGSGGPA
jgi:hypothetical protein